MDFAPLLKPIVEQGPLFAFMVIALYAAAKFIQSTLAKSDVRETERETRYNTLMDKLITVQTEQVSAVTTALVANTEVMKRVERKLEN